MTSKLWIITALVAGSVTLSGCGPAVVGAALFGAGGAVMADKAVEQEKGGEGLF